MNHGVGTPRLTRKKKSEVRPVAGKVLASVFCDLSSVLLFNVLEYGRTITADKYCARLKTLRAVIRKKSAGF